MKKLLLSLTLATLLSLTVSGVSLASGNCQPIYGGGQTCSSTNISINKTVQNPQTGQFVDNLSINDPRFFANQNTTFNLTVTNTGSSNIDRAIVKDILPQYVTFVSGPGSFDQNSKVLSFDINNLPSGQSRTFTVVAKIVADSSISQNSGIVCVTNQSSAQIVSNGSLSQDNSQFCIQKGAIPTTKGGLPVVAAPAMTTTPPTGPEMLPLIGLFPTGVFGFLLRKKASK